MSKVAPHIPADPTAISRSSITPYFIVLVLVGAAAGFLAGVLYAAYGPTRPARLETRVERVLGGLNEQQAMLAQESVAPLLSEKVHDKNIIEPADVGGYATALTSDGWMITTVAAIKGKKVVVRPQNLVAIEKIVSDPASPLVFVKIATNNLKVLNTGSLENILPGAKLAIILPHAALPVTLQERAVCVSDRCPWEYADKLSFAATINESLAPHAADGAAVIDANGALVGLVATLNNRVVIIPIEVAAPLFQDVFTAGKIQRAQLPLRAVNLVHSIVSDPNQKMPEQGMLIEILPTHGATRYTAVGDLQTGDVITRFGHEPIEAGTTFFEAVRRAGASNKLLITIIRKGVEKEISLAL